jgi:hypothetical protein
MGEMFVQNNCDKTEERKYYKHKELQKKNFKTAPLEGITVKFFTQNIFGTQLLVTLKM